MIASIVLLASSAFSAYQVVATTVTKPHPSLERVSYEVQVGRSPLDHFKITRLHQKCGHHRGSVILLSPFLLPGAFYEISELGQYSKSLAGRLAESNFDVWMVDQRQTGLEAGACESGAADCSAMGAWDFNAYSKDALFALALLRTETPRAKPAIGGFSAGANAAMATVNRAPHEFRGLFLYEGTFFTSDPAIQSHNQGICDDLEAKLATGAVYDASGALPGFVLRLSAQDPQSLFPLPVFPQGTSNHQAELYVFGTPPPPGAFAPTPWFVRCAVDFNSQQFVYANQTRLELTGPLFDNYASVAAMRDLACGLAGRDHHHFQNLATFRGKLQIFVGGTGFGPAMFDTASLFESVSDLAIESQAEFGEADFYFHRRWPQVFFRPLRDWLQSVF